MSNGLFSSAGTMSRIGVSDAGSAGGATGGSPSQCDGQVGQVAPAPRSMPSSSVLTSTCPQPETPVCIRAPPISSSVTFSPMTISAMRGEPRYIEALPSRMITTSQNAGM